MLGSEIRGSNSVVSPVITINKMCVGVRVFGFLDPEPTRSRSRAP